MTTADAPTIESLWAKRPAMKQSWAVLSIYNVILGGLLVVGGPKRLTGPSFILVHDFGGPFVWGGLFLVGGVAIATSALFGPRGVARSLILGAIIHGWFATQFIVAAYENDNAALTGPPTYLLVAVTHAIIAIAYRTHR